MGMEHWQWKTDMLREECTSQPCLPQIPYGLLRFELAGVWKSASVRIAVYYACLMMMMMMMVVKFHHISK
jgi:hypothetical protein